MEKAKKIVNNKTAISIISILAVIGLVTAIGISVSKHASTSSAANKAYKFEYKLSAGQKIYTQVAVGQGVILQLWANQPFSVIASQPQPDGSIKTEEYIMPAGESGWLGGEPAGVFTIKGITESTLVRILRR